MLLYVHSTYFVHTKHTLFKQSTYTVHTRAFVYILCTYIVNSWDNEFPVIVWRYAHSTDGQLIDELRKVIAIQCNPEFDAKDVDPYLHKRMIKAVEDGSIKSHCFWQETRLQQSLTSTISTRSQASRWGALMQQRWMADAAAMFMRSTRDCVTLGAESQAWEVLRLRRLPIGSSLRTLTGRSVRLTLVSVARRIKPDEKLKCVWLLWYMFVPVITSRDLVCTLYIPSTNQVYWPTGQLHIFSNRTDRYARMYWWKVSCNIWSLGKTVVSLASTYWYILSQTSFEMYILGTYQYENPVLVHTKYILFLCFRTDVPVRTRSVLVRTFSKGFAQGVRIPDACDVVGQLRHRTSWPKTS